MDEYTRLVNERLENLKELKENLEEYLADESLKKFSKKFNEQAQKLWWPIGLLSLTSVVLFMLALCKLNSSLVIPNLNNTKEIAYYLVNRLGVTLILLVPAFYLLRYAIKLHERKNEYENKALVLSTFPALNFLLEGDSERFELIKTLILENQKLWTISEDRGSSEDITKILSLLRDFTKKE